MPEDDDTLSKLLRLKRHEQPPPEYFEQFLRDFHFRQRAELLRRPAWRIALDRMEAFWGRISLSQVSYAGASLAVLMVAGVFTVNMLEHPGGHPGVAVALPGGAAVASHSPLSSSHAARDGAAIPVQVVSAPAYATSQLTLDPQIRFPDAFQNQVARPRSNPLHPRYILDPRPASYEPPFSF